MFVKLTAVHERYLKLVKDSQCCETQLHAHRDIRTLRKYLQPPLAQTDINLELGAKKVGSFFCTLRTFHRIAKIAEKPDVDFKRREGRRWITDFGNFLRSRRHEIEKGEWDVVEYIRAVPADMWLADVALHINKSLSERCSMLAKLRNVSVRDEWPYNPQECPSNFHDLPRHEFSFAISTYFTMEREVYRNNNKIMGPLLTSFSIGAFTDATVAFQSLMNRVGCMASYQTVDGIRKRAVARRAQEGPFGDVIPTAFHSVAFDNINVRTMNSLGIHGKNAHGFDGFASQLVDANPSFDFQSLCRGSRKEDLIPRKLADVDRHAFIQEMCPGKDEPNLTLYNYTVLGLTVRHRAELISEDPNSQRSLRNIPLNSFQGFSGGKARVVYVTVDRSSAQDEITIVRELRKIERSFYDISNNSGVHVVLAIVGDQPVFKMLFKLFLESYLTGTRLCKWMVPIPGGFHIDKQGMIPTVKEYLAGSGLEELAQFSGLSQKHKEDIIKLGNYRKNRRFLTQVLASMLLRVEDVCREESGTELSKELDLLMERDIANNTQRKRGEESDEDRRRRAEELRKLIPTGCEMQLNQSVSSEIIKAGKLLCEEIERISRHSINMKFFGECGLLNTLLPWSAYNILTRRCQTKVIDISWFKFAGLLHGTGKLAYQENMLWYMLIKKVMPKVAYDVLYEEGHLLMSISDLPGSNLHLDEALEMGVIRHTKMLNTCIERILEQSPALTMLVGRHRDALEANLNPSRKRNSRNADLKNPPSPSDISGYIRIDDKKRTAVNVSAMYAFLTTKGWLSKDHLNNHYLTNVLRGGERKFDPFFVKSNDIAMLLINAEEKGKLYAGLHLSAKMEEISGELTEDDVAKHFGGRALGPGKWTLRFKFKSMRDLDPSRNESTRGTKRLRSARSQWERYLSRGRDINNIKEKLTKVLRFSSEGRRKDAGSLIDEVERKEHVLAAKSFAFRKNLDDDTPNYESSSRVLDCLQDALMTSPAVTNSEIFYEGPGPHVPNCNFSSIHFDVTEWTRYAPSLSLEDVGIGACVYDKFRRDLRKFVRNEKYRHAVDIHFHTDVEFYMPKQRLHRPDISADDLAWRSAMNETASECQDKQNLYADFETPLEGNWGAFYKDSGNRTFLSMLHVVLAGKAMVNGIEEERGSSCLDTGNTLCCLIYLHGVAITITDDARECPLAMLKFSRIGSTLLVSRRGGSDDAMMKSTRLLESAESYAPDCCWLISKNGLQRKGGGDFRHGETQTRIIRAIMAITEARFRQLRFQANQSNILVVSKAKGVDGPIIACCMPRLRNLRIVYRIKETTVEVVRLFRALYKAGVSAEHLALLYAMGGCGTLPSTHKVSTFSYVKAFVQHRSVIGDMRDKECGFDLRNYQEETWNSFERLVAAAYVESVGKG